MKLEFLRNINEYNEHAVRLSDFNSSEAALFSKAIDAFISDSSNKLDISALDFITPVNCSLVLRVSSQDFGISTPDGVHFFCDLSIGGYHVISKLLQPFCLKESKGYQWLYDLDTPIGFLFSAGTDIPEDK